MSKVQSKQQKPKVVVIYREPTPEEQIRLDRGIRLLNDIIDRFELERRQKETT